MALHTRCHGNGDDVLQPFHLVPIMQGEAEEGSASPTHKSNRNRHALTEPRTGADHVHDLAAGCSLKGGR